MKLDRHSVDRPCRRGARRRLNPAAALASSRRRTRQGLCCVEGEKAGFSLRQGCDELPIISDADDFDSGRITGDGARETLLRHFAGAAEPRPLQEASPSDVEPQVAELREALRRAQGGLEIARLALEDIADAHAMGQLGDTQGKLRRFALGQINGL